MTRVDRREKIRQRLIALMPVDVVDNFLFGAMREAGIGALETPDEQLLLAEVLTRRSGVYRILGRSLKIDALLAGAVENAGR